MVFEITSHQVDQASLDLAILLPQPPRFWDYRHVSPTPSSSLYFWQLVRVGIVPPWIVRSPPHIFVLFGTKTPESALGLSSLKRKKLKYQGSRNEYLKHEVYPNISLRLRIKSDFLETDVKSPNALLS